MPFQITVPCKSYVKHYLESNYGNPVNLQLNSSLYKHLIGLLSGDKNLRKRYYFNVITNYSEFVKVNLKKTDFYKHKWILNESDVINFNLRIQLEVKTFMRSIVGTRIALGENITDSIHFFQDNYGYTEEVWSFDTIRKDCQRNLDIERGSAINDILNKINKNNFVKLS